MGEQKQLFSKEKNQLRSLNLLRETWKRSTSLGRMSLSCKALDFLFEKGSWSNFCRRMQAAILLNGKAPHSDDSQLFSPLGLAGLWPGSSIPRKTSFNQGLSGHKKPSKTEAPFNYRIFGIFFANKPSDLCSVGFHVGDIEAKRKSFEN